MDLLKHLSPAVLINKILENEALADALLKALSVSLEAKKQVESQYEQTLSSLSLAPLSRLQAAEEELSVLEAELEALREQLLSLSAEARAGRSARSELSAAQAEIESLKAELEAAQQAPRQAPQAAADSPQAKLSWSAQMTKGKLLSLAREQGLELKGTMKKAEIIAAISAVCGAPEA